MRPVILAISIFSVLSVPVFSAQELSLATAIQEGKLKSPSILKSTALLREASFKKEEILGSGFAPKLSANSSYSLSRKYEVLDIPFNGETVTFPSIYPTTVYGIKAKLPLFDGFANQAALDSSDLLEQAAQENLNLAEFQLEQSIRLAYFHAFTAQQLLTVTEHHVKVLQDHLKQVQIQKKGGTATAYDELRIQVQLSEAELDAADAKDNVVISHQNLIQLLGIVQDDRRLIDEIPSPDIKRLEQLVFDGTFKTRSDIQSLRLHCASLEKQEHEDTPWFVPQIAAVGSADLYNNQNDAIASDAFRSAYQTAVVLNWNLFDGNVSKAKSDIAHAQREKIEADINAAKLNAYGDFEQMKRKYISNTRRFEIKNLDTQRSEESVRLARLEARAGSRTNTEVLDAELDLFRSKAGSVLAKMNAVEALINLEITLGRRL